MQRKQNEKREKKLYTMMIQCHRMCFLNKNIASSCTVRECSSMFQETIRQLFIHLVLGVFSPNVKHKYGGNEKQTHDKNWNWSNFKSR